MAEFVQIEGVRLQLSQAHPFMGQWIGQGEILKQILACWLVTDKSDLPLTPRITGARQSNSTPVRQTGFGPQSFPTASRGQSIPLLAKVPLA